MALITGHDGNAYRANAETHYWEMCRHHQRIYMDMQNALKYNKITIDERSINTNIRYVGEYQLQSKQWMCLLVNGNTVTYYRHQCEPM